MLANGHTANGQADGNQPKESRRVAVCEDRREPRLTLLLRTAKLLADQTEWLCIIRDVSRSGVRVQLFHPLPRAAAFALELADGERHAIALVWQADEFAGFRFHHGIDLARFVHGSGERNKRKFIRLHNRIEGTLGVDGQERQIDIVNISQQGACIECEGQLAIGQLVSVRLGALPPTFAKVKWRTRPRYGLIFEQVYRFEELARRLVPGITM